MPLSEKTRIEVYLPDLPTPAYQKLLEALRREFTHALGGSTLVRNLSGTYLSRLGLTVEDRVICCTPMPRLTLRQMPR